jgi:hypothetical protein
MATSVSSRKASEESQTSLRSEYEFEWLNPVGLIEKRHEVRTDHCGTLQCYVQGDPEQVHAMMPVFLTLHDLGSNRKLFLPFFYPIYPKK